MWELRDSLNEDRDDSLSHLERAELNRRLDEHEANPYEGTPWETVRDEILAGLRQRSSSAKPRDKILPKSRRGTKHGAKASARRS